MAKLAICSKCRFESESEYECRCSKCITSSDFSGFVPKTNADHIRSMSDEELVKFLHNFNDCDCCLADTCGYSCEEGMLQWLKSEVKEEV